MSASRIAPSRLIALGASNLTRGLPQLLRVAGSGSAGPIEFLVALGLGRSYGLHSRVLFRRLPSVLECGLWGRLSRLPPVPTIGLVTDVGNDILYGASVESLSSWVEECVARLRRAGATVVVLGLPLASIARVSGLSYLFFRTLFAPGCRLPREVVRERAAETEARLRAVAVRWDATFVPTDPGWYGMDPVHIRRRHVPEAWRRLLGRGGDASGGTAGFGTLETRLAAPECRWLFGLERRATQPSVVTPRGDSLSLF